LEEGVQRGILLAPAAAGSLTQLALMAVDRDDWDAAAGAIEEAREVVVRHHLTHRPPQALLFAASTLVLAHHGEPRAEAEALHTRRLLTMLNHVSSWIPIEARLVLGRAELVLGDTEVATVLAQEAGELLRRFPDPGLLERRSQELTTAITSATGRAAGMSVPLTTAELRVLRYLPTHLSFQAMADELFVSRNTVKTQAIAIYRKLGVSSRGDAVDRATELGLLER
jgi:LuxR family maltose regulon positive regulatory protein